MIVGEQNTSSGESAPISLPLVWADGWTLPHGSKTLKAKDVCRKPKPVPNLPRVALGLAIGAAGGFLFALLSLPLPWMLGALTASMVASVARLPVLAPVRIRPAVVAVIGVLLGSRFTPDVVGQAAAWLGSLSLLLIYLLAVGAVVVPFYIVVGRFDRTTAYFAGMPGGLTEMIEIGESKGANVHALVLAHSLRIVVTIALIAVWFRVVEGYDVGTAPAGPAHPLTLYDAMVMLACAVLGSVAGKALKFPAPTFLGPMALSAVLHLVGFTESVPPTLLVNAAQVILGTVLGCRFLGIGVRELARASVLSLGATLLTLALALGFAWVIHVLIGAGTDQGLLALAPGGLTEMGLIALAIHADVAFVALHHVVRILLVIVLAPVLYSIMDRVLSGRS